MKRDSATSGQRLFIPLCLMGVLVAFVWSGLHRTNDKAILPEGKKVCVEEESRLKLDVDHCPLATLTDSATYKVSSLSSPIMEWTVTGRKSISAGHWQRGPPAC